MQTTFGGVSYSLPIDTNHLYYSGFMARCIELAGWVYGFHMPLFFMLSGAVLALRPMPSFDHIFKSKIERLLIPYFVCGWIFMLPIKRLGGFYNNSTFIQALNGFLSGMDSGHLWFLTALFWCIIIFCIAYKGLKKLGINSRYALLLLAGLIQLTYSFIPFDILGLKMGLSYIFYLALGYVFECERRIHKKWNMKKILLVYGIMVLLEILNRYYGILNGVFLVLVGSFITYLLADICSRWFTHIAEKKIWNIIIQNLFYVYLLHDPLNYVVLRLFMNSSWLSSSWGCIVFLLSRTVFMFILCIVLGEGIGLVNRVFGKILADKSLLNGDIS